MSSKPPEDEDELDEGWDVDGGADAEASSEEDAGSVDSSATPRFPDGPPTWAVGAAELFRRAGASPSGRIARMPPPPSESAPKTTPPHFEAATDQRATVPPPVPESEYVARMMDHAPSSEHGLRIDVSRASVASGYRRSYATLPETDPLQFDLEDQIVAPLRSTEAGAARRPTPSPDAQAPSERDEARTSSPEIETGMVELSDIDPDLLRDTPVPAAPGGDDAGSGLDDLPVDEVLSRVSEAPYERGARVSASPGFGRAVDAPRAVSITVRSDRELDDHAHDRPTLTGEQLANPRSQVRVRFEAGDYSGALVIAEGLLEEDPDDAEAQRYAEACRDVLRQMYVTRLGDGSKALRLAVSVEELRWLTLDHRTGFLLSRIDGETTVDELLDLSGMPSLDTIRALFELVQQGVLEVVDPPPPSSGR